MITSLPVGLKTSWAVTSYRWFRLLHRSFICCMGVLSRNDGFPYITSVVVRACFLFWMFSSRFLSQEVSSPPPSAPAPALYPSIPAQSSYNEPSSQSSWGTTTTSVAAAAAAPVTAAHHQPAQQQQGADWDDEWDDDSDNEQEQVGFVVCFECSSRAVKNDACVVGEAAWRGGNSSRRSQQ